MTTPMMRQYHEAKAACGDALLFFRMGDFYELFLDDAKVASRVLGLTLTSRDKDSDNPTAMAGFPHHQLDGYLQKLIRAGYRAAVCEQVEDPKQAKGLVRREITRLVSAGTLTDDSLLNPREANFLAAIYRPAVGKGSRSVPGVALPSHDRSAARGASSGGAADGPCDDEWVGIAWAELSSGQFEAGVFPASRLEDELERIGPAELIYREDDARVRPDTGSPWSWTKRPAWTFGLDHSQESLCKQFGTQSLEGFGFDASHDPAIQAAGAVLAYLQDTQRVALDHFEGLIPHDGAATLQIDAATRRSLEITRTMRTGSREGSLLEVIDLTETAMGARLLADWLAAPLTNLAEIACRQEAIGELCRDVTLRGDIRSTLDEIFDLTRLIGRVATQRCGPRDLQQISRTLSILPDLKRRLASTTSTSLRGIEADLEPLPELRQRLESALAETCPLSAADGHFIRPGFDAALDSLRELARGGKQWIASYQQRMTQETGIANLKVGFNRVFGYYLEINQSQMDKVPADFIRKQTLKNCERYITPELKTYEEKVLAADDDAATREQELFLQLRSEAHRALRPLRRIAAALAELDVLASLAELAAQRGWIRPTLTAEPILRIEAGRHPVLDIKMAQGEFVPNDCFQSPEAGMVLLITGPNMAGKSTYIRQVALLTLLAQTGSFIPATQATIGVADRIFARVGASDELGRGQSTFMVEMVETARILNTATTRSLVILDEIGRGTSTYDGLALAWAITEHLHERIGCRTLFATHYHELTQLQELLPRVSNLNVAVREWNDSVVFLHRIIPGGADKSYGIHVARLAGIPSAVNERAKDILAQLEADHRNSLDQPTIQPPHGRKSGGAVQLTLFGFADHPVVDELRKLDIDAMSPMDALQFVHNAKRSIVG